MKADMNGDIPLEKAATFFLANLYHVYLKQGISSEYVMVDFICKGLLGLSGMRVGITKWKILARSGIRTLVPSAYKANTLTIVLLDLISIEHLKVDQNSPECHIKIYLYTVVDFVKCHVVYYILLTLYSQQTSKLVKQKNNTNIIWGQTKKYVRFRSPDRP